MPRHRERFYAAVAEILPALPSIREALRIVEARGRGGADMVASSARAGVDRGLGLADALERGASPPPSDELAIIRAAEESGTLAERLATMSERLRERRESRRRLIGRIAYPVFLFHLAAVVGGVFAGSDGAFVIVAIVDAAVIFAFWLASTHRARGGGLARFWLSLPVAGRLSSLDDTERVTSVASALYGSGRPLAAAMRSAAPAARFDAHRNEIEAASERLASGEAAEVVLGEIAFFDPDVRDALVLSAPVGRLENGLEGASTLARRRRESGVDAALKGIGLLIYVAAAGYAAWTILSFWTGLYSAF